MVEFLQPDLSIIAYMKTGREPSGNVLLLKNHYRVTRLRQAIGGH